MQVRHGSKYDPWILVILGVGTVVGSGATLLAVTKDSGDPMVAVACVFAPALLMALLIWPLYYEITDEDLRIRCGLLRVRVPVREIATVTPTRNLLSSPAMSLDRLDIEYQGKHVMISPADKDAFIQDLLGVAPQLVRTGDRLSRR